MSHHFINKLADYDSSGPRPPVPGQEETQKYKMTDTAQHELHILMTSSSSSQSSSSPSCLKWARTLSSLLEDRDGVELFKKYVEQEGGIHSDRLNFYFACEGLKQQSDNDKVRQIIGAIYRFLKKSELPVPEEIRQTVKTGLKNKQFVFTPDVFDQMQQDVERIINETTYRNFLQSDMYLLYVQNYHSAIERNLPPAAHNTTNATTATSLTISESSSIFLSRSSTLPTLHEEGDGTNADGSDGGAVGGFSDTINRVPTVSGSSTSTTKVPMSLTKDALMATQRRRLEMRPPGAHGFSVYNAYASYNTVSRRDSELASLSSGRTDSDTMSNVSSMKNDGRPQRRLHQAHHSSSLERRLIRENVPINNDNGSIAIIPRTQQVDPKLQALSQVDFLKILIPKLELVKKKQDQDQEVRARLHEVDQAKNNKSIADAIKTKFMLDDDKDDQDILDQHVSRVWSDMTPHRSPGNMSPCNQFQRRKPHEMMCAPGGSTQSSMRTSKSMPDSNMRKFSKWGSINTDSGISLFSSDTMRPRDAMSISSSNSSSIMTNVQRSSLMLPPEATPLAANKMAQQLEDARRSKRYHQQPPLPQKNIVPPPLPAKNSYQPVQTPAPAMSNVIEQTTTVVYSFCDEDVPYRIKIPGRHPPTLKQFKDYLPKKGNYRFFFKTRCDDEDNPIIQEEMCNDSDVLPLFEGKVMATVKSAN